ncbi:MAG: hypothetical protein U0599_20785 [Vicinamibacteria bacterium]
MRTKMAFLACSVAVAGLLAASGASAGNNYNSCSSWAPTVTVTAGPCPVSSATPAACEAAGPYTAVRYKVTGNADTVAALVTANNGVVSGGTVYPPCKGDPATGLGAKSCHEKAVVFGGGCGGNVSAEFWVVVEGKRGPVLQSVALKKDSCVKSFAVTGVGYEISAFQQLQTVESVNFKGCVVDFIKDPLTGAVTDAVLNQLASTKVRCSTTGQTNCCSDVMTDTVDKLSLTLNGVELGAGQIGEGYVSSGTNSCTTRVIGGRVYTWGSPCPE